MEHDDNLIVPTQNPDIGKPATVEPRTSRLEIKTKIKGTALVPDISDRGGPGVLTEYRYWVGITPSCPVESLDLAGINFPKVNEELILDPLRTNIRQRVPVIGALVTLTKQRVELMRDRLPRTVIRFLESKGKQEEPGTGKNIGDVHMRPRRGHVITIPSAKEVEQRRADGKPTREYTFHKNDVPAARFMFAVLCANQEKGERGPEYPEPLEITGLEWPDELDERTEDLLS